MSEFVVKDSGKREAYHSGMVRDSAEGKKQYHRVLEGPMFERWACHLTKGAVKYPDNADGTANWTKAEGQAELTRFKQSAFRHFMAWYNGEVDEDHAAGVFFNINGVEYVKGKLPASTIDGPVEFLKRIQEKANRENLLNRFPTQPYSSRPGPFTTGPRF